MWIMLLPQQSVKTLPLGTTYYNYFHATIRVPNIKLDTTLKDIAKNIDYLTGSLKLMMWFTNFVNNS